MFLVMDFQSIQQRLTIQVRSRSHIHVDAVTHIDRSTWESACVYNSILWTKFCSVVALTSAGSAKLCTCRRRLWRVFLGLGKTDEERVRDCTWIREIEFRLTPLSRVKIKANRSQTNCTDSNLDSNLCITKIFL